MSARYASRAGAGSAVSLREAVLDVFDSLRASLTTRLQLAALEGRRAGEALAQMLALGALAGILALSAWLVALWAACWGLFELGVPPWVALLLVIAANLLGVWLCWLAMKSQAQRLLFPATLRHLHGTNRADDATATGQTHESP